ncbi:integrase arm-type DNA-binding domain-containing protein [Phenylobacterium sp.]|uniref:tyrosine-type recombinase/integrase n=1 Tax=Phenylobacterium sp. TaxID=1871053 RepID=UPI0025DE477A|nr:integrase arm-type DNA-binding domain-containing protein [Phenylobacterium sp.]
MPLTDAKLRTLKPAAKPYKLSDSEGLHILVTTTGSMLWRLAYRFGGKQKLLALGSYPFVTLADAREARFQAKKLLKDGKDPGHERKMEKRRKRVAEGHTFRAVADEWFELRKDTWAKSYADRLRSRLDADLLPELGARPIASIEPIEVLDVIRKVEKRDAVEMAKRIMQMASAIFRYGVATSRCPRDPTFDLRGALKPAKEVKSRSALAASELPDFLHRLDAYEGDELTRLALELVLLTFVRTAELRFAAWAEFEGLDGDEPLWRIPPERMKMRRAHLVPLAPQAVAVLKKLRKISGRFDQVFPAPTRSKVISENTMLYALYRMGYHGRATVHGFRKTASTVLNEQNYNRDWIEMQLAHAEGSVRSIYNAAEWLPGRRDMMKWWADYLDRRRAEAARPE